MIECPHCGGWIGKQPQRLEDPTFDNRLHRVVIDGKYCRLDPSSWRILLALRERYRHFVPRHGDVDTRAKSR